MPSTVAAAVAALLISALTPVAGPTAGGTVVALDAERFTYVQASAGEQHTVALAADGTVWAWGDNSVGQLGDGSTTGSLVPAPVTGLEGVRIVQVDAGYSHTMALSDDGRVYVWGHGFFGQLGDGQAASSAVPVLVEAAAFGGERVAGIDAGPYTSTAVTASGTGYAWGMGHQGQLGDGGGVSRSVPVAVDISAAGPGARLTEIDAGYAHMVALTEDGRVLSWGEDGDGQLGSTAVSTSSGTPVLVDTTGALAGVRVVDVAAGGHHGLAVDSEGHAYAWGAGRDGQLGDGSLTGSPVPVRVAAPGGVLLAQVEGGFAFSVALGRDGVPYAWGDNGFGATGGTAGPDPTSRPVAVDLGGTAVTRVSAGWEHATATGPAGGVVSWGNDADGQSGNGGTGGAAPRWAVMPDVAVTFDGEAATAVAWSDHGTLRATTPAHESGTVDVRVSEGGNGRYPVTGATSPAAYTFGTPPVVASRSEDVTVDAGTDVVLEATAAGDEPPTVQWQVLGDDARWTPVQQAWTGDAAPLRTATAVTVPAPPAGTSAVYRAVFRNPLGQATTDDIVVTARVAAAVPAGPDGSGTARPGTDPATADAGTESPRGAGLAVTGGPASALAALAALGLAAGGLTTVAAHRARGRRR